MAETIENEALAPDESVLRNRSFLLLWLAQALSQTAQNAIWYGLIVVVEQVSQSTTHLSVAVLTTIIPPILLGMAAGVVVDRVNRKTVLIATNVLRAVTVLGYLLYPVSLYYVYVMNLILVSISQFFGPAEVSTIPSLVPRKRLIAANSLFNLTFTGSQLAGIVLLGPPLIKLLGPSGLFICAAVAFAVAGALCSLLPPDSRVIPGLSGLDRHTLVAQVWREILAGWRFANSNRYIWSAMLHLTITAGLILVMSMLVPRFVVSVLEVRADDAAYVFAPAGVGVVLGTLSLSRLAQRFAKTSLVSFGLLAVGGAMFALSVLAYAGKSIGAGLLASLGMASMPSGVGLIPAVMAIVVVMGFGFALTSVPSQTIIMEHAPIDSRGRIFAAQMLMANLAAVFPLIFLGGLADIFGVGLSLALIGGVVVYAGVLNVRRWRMAPAAVGPAQP